MTNLPPIASVSPFELAKAHTAATASGDTKLVALLEQVLQAQIDTMQAASSLSFTTVKHTEPVRVATDVHDTFFHNDEWQPTLVRWQETWWVWQAERGIWVECSDEAVDGKLQKHLQHATYNGPQGLVAWLPNKNKLGTVRHALQEVARVPDDLAPGGWLNHGQLDEQPRMPTIDCRGNRLEQSQDGENWRTAPAGPERFNTSVLAVPYDAGAAVPECWLKFLRETFDAEGQMLAQEWAGYLISGSTYASKWIQIIGPPRAGKTLFTNVMAALFGHSGAATSLEALAGPFGLQGLVTAPYATIDDARLKGSGAIERLLSITGGGIVFVDRKHKSPLSMRLPARIMMCANSPVQIDDGTGALAARSLFLRAPWSKVGREDWFLEAVLTSPEVLQGILVWALDGLARLEANGWRFTVPASSQEDRELSTALGSPLAQFLAERCSAVPAEFGQKLSDVHAAYLSWRAGAGLRAQSQKQTEVELRAAGHRVARIGPESERGPWMVLGWVVATADR